ncbi:hypothetical protein [uncultured Celeribacter sp.]|uniref:hypothetical protein n=1 Tax=uncultured Celeribacter sp. TaxID=1303376 RepID=UPI002AA61FAC|nr:hypothetical protein [uncultured Celeribacter sp.]
MKYLLLVGGLLALAGCEAPLTTEGYLKEVPEGLAEVAAPNQNLAAVQINPEDGCYWYRHEGPVETTLLPLRAKNGRPICTEAPATLETAM